jgi:hypothetical protein
MVFYTNNLIENTSNLVGYSRCLGSVTNDDTRILISKKYKLYDIPSLQEIMNQMKIKSPLISTSFRFDILSEDINSSMYFCVECNGYNELQNIKNPNEISLEINYKKQKNQFDDQINKLKEFINSNNENNPIDNNSIFINSNYTIGIDTNTINTIGIDTSRDISIDNTMDNGIDTNTINTIGIDTSRDNGIDTTKDNGIDNTMDNYMNDYIDKVDDFLNNIESNYTNGDFIDLLWNFITNNDFNNLNYLISTICDSIQNHNFIPFIKKENQCEFSNLLTNLNQNVINQWLKVPTIPIIQIGSTSIFNKLKSLIPFSNDLPDLQNQPIENQIKILLKIVKIIEIYELSSDLNSPEISSLVYKKAIDFYRFNDSDCTRIVLNLSKYEDYTVNLLNQYKVPSRYTVCLDGKNGCGRITFTKHDQDYDGLVLWLVEYYKEKIVFYFFFFGRMLVLKSATNSSSSTSFSLFTKSLSQKLDNFNGPFGNNNTV